MSPLEDLLGLAIVVTLAAIGVLVGLLLAPLVGTLIAAVAAPVSAVGLALYFALTAPPSYL